MSEGLPTMKVKSKLDGKEIQICGVGKQKKKNPLLSEIDKMNVGHGL